MTLFDVWQGDNPRLSIPDFFLWLEERNIPNFFPSILLIDENELSNYEIFIQDNVIYKKNGEVLHHIASDSELIFIIDHNLRVLACSTTDKIRHPSLSYYKPILGSGSLWVNNGHIVKISLNSGHYIPQIKHYIQTIKILEEKSLMLRDDLVLHYYENFEEVLSTVGAFKSKYMAYE